MINKSILIVDDEKNIRLTLSQALETLGAEIDTAANGEEALTKLKGRKFGLILLDIRMPGMDGMEVLHRVREVHAGRPRGDCSEEQSVRGPDLE